MEISSDQLDMLEALAASLHYLESETEASGMADISRILRKAIDDIEVWVRPASAQVKHL